MGHWQFMGFVASILGALTFAPEIVQALRSKHLDDLSWGVLLLLGSSSALWFGYGINFEVLPLIFSSTINLIMCVVLVYLKEKYKTNSINLKILPGKIRIQGKK